MSPHKLTISGSLLATLQGCPRRWRLEQEWRIIRHSPSALFRQTLTQAILALSSGEELERVVGRAKADFLGAAASPGLDTLTDPYTLAQDYVAALSTILQAIHTTIPPRLEPRADARAADARADVWDGYVWEYSALWDREGASHRWVMMESRSPAALSRLVHGWDTVGDLAHSAAPLYLHVLELGAQRGGHLHGVWSRTFQHPAIAHKYQFQRADGRRLGPGWRPIWFKQTALDARAWVEMLTRDQVGMVREIHLEPLSPLDRADVLSQVEELVRHMEYIRRSRRDQGVGKWPVMARAACDLPRLCPWQPVCYQHADHLVPPEQIGGYVRRV